MDGYNMVHLRAQMRFCRVLHTEVGLKAGNLYLFIEYRFSLLMPQ